MEASFLIHPEMNFMGAFLIKPLPSGGISASAISFDGRNDGMVLPKLSIWIDPVPFRFLFGSIVDLT